MHAEDDEKADSHEGEDDEKSLSSHNFAAKVSKIRDGCALFLLKFEKWRRLVVRCILLYRFCARERK